MKVYVKPEVHIEKFSLSKHIASCAYDMKNPTIESSCVAYGDEAYNRDGMNIFSSSNTNCNFDESNSEFYCYTNGTEDMNIFNS